MVKDRVTYLETFLLVEESESLNGIASGTITDALTGNGLGDVTLTVRKGWNNTLFGETIDIGTTDSYGNYSFTLPLGNYTVNATKAGYVRTAINIVVQENETSNQNGTLTPIVDSNLYRIVLTWGENPSDLDSHVEGKISDRSTFHVYYDSMSAFDGNEEVCYLDVDDTSSFGPETITLKPSVGDAYYYYIYKYSGSGTVANSGAQVKVYKGDNLINTFNVPSNLGDSDYWNVFAIKNGEMVIQNTITDRADIEYAE